jgi:uncharacterized protein
MSAVVPEKFLPGRHQIEGFGKGGFRFGGMSHNGSLLILPSGMRAIAVASIADVAVIDLEMIVAEKSEIDFLLIGVGAAIAPLSAVLRDYLKSENINFDIMDTRAAARTYNVVLAEDRRVAALLIAFDD